MKRILVRLLALLFVVGGLLVVMWPVENWRMYDAVWQPLAMTEAEAYCSGFVASESGSILNEPDESKSLACIEEAFYENDKPNIGLAVQRFCEGIHAHIDFPVNECTGQVEAYDIWPVLHGGYTWEWNESNKRPEVVHSDLQNAPSRKERNDDTRTNGERLGD